MIKKRFLKYLMLAMSPVIIALNGCTNSPQKDLETQIQTTESSPTVLTKVPDRSFSSDTLYALLVAEIAIDRKRYDIALGNYVQQASSTRDPEVTARATHIARILKAHQPALEMAELWVDLEPDNSDAHLIATAELLHAGRLLEAFDKAQALLNRDDSSVFEAIAANAAKGEIEVTRQLIEQYQQLISSHPEHVPLLVGYSLLLEQDKRADEALNAVQNALKLDDNNIRAAFQETRLLQQQGRRQEAIKKLANLVKKNPENGSIRARYARFIATTDLEEAHRQYEILLEQSPQDPDILFTLGLIERERNLLPDAIKRFGTLIEQGDHVSQSHFQMGKIRDTQDQQDAALTHYLSVAPGQNYLAAMTRSTQILINSDRDYEALQLVKSERNKVDTLYREGLYLLESELLSSSGQRSAAEIALSKGIEEFPESTALLYSRAMLYANADYIAAAEKDLKLILQLAPENAAALNALGYTLVDKTERIDEAYSYIQKAIALTPDDPAVMDSMGWAEYRRGNHQQALIYLRQAMKAMPDHEIAAHLGEVLWITGLPEEAISVWKQGLTLKPDSEIIHETLHRLNVNLEHNEE